MPLIDAVLLLLVAVVWGFNFIVIKIGLENFPPILFSALRFLFAAVPLAFFLPRPAVSWRIVLSIGLVLGVVKFSLLFIAMDVGLSPGLASLLLQSQVFFTVALAAVFYGTRPRPAPRGHGHKNPRTAHAFREILPAAACISRSTIPPAARRPA